MDDFAIKQATAPVCCRRFQPCDRIRVGTGWDEGGSQFEATERQRGRNLALRYDAQGANEKGIRDGLVNRP